VPPDVRVSLGAAADIPSDQCLAVADGRAVVVRVGDDICAYRNQCVHQDAPLAGGIVRGGVLSCPLHFWRYHADSGQLIGSRQRLERFPVEVVGGEAFLIAPDEPPRRSLREQLLERAREYERSAAWERDHTG
jgi:nitrite reductase/ring-hydroxylating ferredoxin subunit